MSRSRVGTSLNPKIRALLGLTNNPFQRLNIPSIAQGIFGSQRFVSSFHSSSISRKPMSHFLCRTIPFVGCHSLRALEQTSNVSFVKTRWFSVSSQDNQKHSFAISYLMNSLGLSQKDALLVSKRINLETREKPDKAIEFLKGYDFTRSQISTLVRSYPSILLSDTEKTILPKLEFLIGKGLSGPEMASVLSSFPCFLRSSLANQIMPSYDFYKSLFDSDEKVMLAVKRAPDILVYNIEKYVSPNISTLRQQGVPISKIFMLVRNWPRVLSTSPARFQKGVEKVVEMGFDPSKSSFIQATRAIVEGTCREKWENRAEAYKKWGWSDEEVLIAFKTDPRCMLLSVDRITTAMEYLVTEMDSNPCHLAKSPAILFYNLKRVMSRYSVHRVLVSRGLLKKEVRIISLVRLPEPEFLKRFVSPYVKEAPELLKTYKKIMDSSSGTESDED